MLDLWELLVGLAMLKVMHEWVEDVVQIPYLGAYTLIQSIGCHDVIMRLTGAEHGINKVLLSSLP